MAFDRAAAKAAGYSDEEINAYLQANPEVEKKTPPPPQGSEDVPPPPSTVIPEIDRTNEVLGTIAAGSGGLLGEVAGLAKDLAVPAATAYGAYKLGKVADAAVNRMGQGPVSPVGSAQNPIGAQGGRPVPVSGAAAPESVPINRAPAPTAGAGAVAPEAQAAAQAARTAAPEAGGIMSKMAPYLQQAGKFLGPAARVAGPAGAVASAYEAAPYLQQAEIGPRAASGEVGRMARGANRMGLNMPTPAPLSAQEARNLLASGDERTINIYGGRAKLQAIANPNALNSGYAQELNRLGR
jgi:hypothetical protein